jgi:glyoxylase-like metal-dependent hydrolase (beta-lactamase superfamily II)
MLKRLVLIVLLLVALAVGILAAFLIDAHLAVRREAAPLPALDAVQAVSGVGAIVDDAPMRLSVIDTATQAMPRASVLDSAADRDGDQPYVMSHPAFVLEWKDGRVLLIDTGMTEEGAREFGRPLEWVGASPLAPRGSTASQLGDAVARVKGVVFTHLHIDHVGGIAEICRHVNSVRVPMTEAQAERINYTTRPGRDLLEDADCVRLERVSAGPLSPVAGFPGVFVIDAGGHTPGSQILLAFVRDGADTRSYAFTGDIVNHIDGINHDIPKPWLYRTLLVPESDARQAELRAFLKRLRDEAGFTLLVSHDKHAIDATGVPAWNASAVAGQ